MAVCEAGQWEIDGALYPQGYVFGADIGHGSTHGVGFYECQRARGGREYVMRGAPVPRHQLQRIRDARQEDEAYREESDHQQRSVRIGKKDRSGQPEKRCGQQVRNHQHDDFITQSDVGETEYDRHQAQQEKGEYRIQHAIDEGLADHDAGHVPHGQPLRGKPTDRSLMAFAAADHGDDHQQGLENNHHKNRRNQVTAVSFGVIVQGGAHDGYGFGLRNLLDVLLRQKNQHLGTIPAVELHHGPGRCFLHCQIIEECIGSPVHDEDRLPAPVDTRLEVVGDVDDSDYFALFQQLFGAGKIRFGRVDAHLRRSIDQSGVLAAQRAVRPIDHRDGCIADQVRFVHVIVEEAVDEDSSDQHQQDGVARGDDPEFPGRDRRDIRQSVFYFNRCFHSDGSKRPV